MTVLGLGDPYPIAAAPGWPAALAALHAGDERVAVVSCLDLRVDPVTLLGVPRRRIDLMTFHQERPGEELDSALRASRELLGSRHVVVLGHQQCVLRGPGTPEDVVATVRSLVERVRSAADAHDAVVGLVLDPRGRVVTALEQPTL
jgi:hypothetical protein